MLNGLSRMALAAAMLALGHPASAAPESFVYSGRIIKPDQSYLEASNVSFTVQIYSPGAEDCLLYEETHTLNMSRTLGLFAIPVGRGTRSGAQYEDTSSLAEVLDNAGPSISGLSCAVTNTYTPAPGDSRRLRVSFNDGSGNVAMDPTIVRSVPYAQYASSVGGRTADDLIQVNGSSNLTQANAETIFSNFTELQALINGTSLQYATRSSNGASQLPSFATATPPTSPSAGDIWYDSDAGFIKYHDGAGIQTVGTAASSGTVTDISLGAGLVDGAGNPGTTITTSGTIALPTVVAAGTYSKVTVDAYGRVTTGASLDESDIPNLTSAGKVSGDTITSGTIGGSAALNTTGNITTSGTVTGSAFSGRSYVLWDSDDTNSITINPPATGALTSNYSLVLPPTAGTAGFALVTDGTGNLSWVDITHGTGDYTAGQITNVAAGNISATDVQAAINELDTEKQPVSSELTGVAGLSTTGIIERTGAGTFATIGKGGAIGQIPLVTSALTTDVLVRWNNTDGGLEPFVCGANEYLEYTGAIWSCVDSATDKLAFHQNGDSFGAAATLGTNDNYDLHFETNNSQRLSITSGGDVGIGTTTPGTKLEVMGNVRQVSSSPTLTLRNSVSGGGEGSIVFEKANTGTSGEIRVLGAGMRFHDTRSNGFFSYYIGASGEQARITANGSLGLGTSNPQEKLDVEGSVVSGPKGTAAGDGGAIRLEELAVNGTNSVGFRAPDLINTDVLWQLPAADGGAGTVLSTNGAGVLSWANPGAGVKKIQDTDGDTRVDVEESADEDIVRIYAGGTNSFKVYPTALPSADVGTGVLVTPPASNSSSLYIKNSSSSGGSNRLFFGHSWGSTNYASVGTNGGDSQHDHSLELTTYSDRDIVLKPNNVERFRILGENGNVGIGTTTPTRPLHVVGEVYTSNLFRAESSSGGSVTGLVVSNTHAGTNGPDSEIVLRTGGLDRAFIQGGADGASSAGRLKFYTRQSGAMVESMRINSSGNVGIGTTSPTSPLHIASSATDQLLRIETLATSAADAKIKVKGARNASVGQNIAAIEFSNFDNDEAGGTEYVMGSVAGTQTQASGQKGGLNFSVNNGFGPVTRMTLDHLGNLGVGTFTPNEKLTVEGAISLDQLASDPVGTAGYGALYTKTDGKLYYRDGLGTVTDLLSGAGAGDFKADGSVAMTGTIKAAAGSVAAPSITFDADQDTGISSPGGGTMRFSNNGNLMMEILDGAIDVYEDINHPDGYGMVWGPGEDTAVRGAQGASGYVTVKTNGTEKMRVTADGKIGLGYTTPTWDLSFAQGNGRFIGVQDKASGNGDYLTIKAGSGTGLNASGGTLNLNSGASRGTGSSQIAFNTSVPAASSSTLNSVSTQMIIKDGQVGVGTTTPNEKLTVEGAISLDQLIVDPVGTAGYGALYTKTDGSLYYRDGIGTIKNLSSATGDISDGGNTKGAAITIGTNDNFGLNLEANNTTAFSISNSGELSSPNALRLGGASIQGGSSWTGLAVGGPGGSRAQIEINGSRGAGDLESGNLTFFNSTHNIATIGARTGSSSSVGGLTFSTKNGVGTAERMRLDENGNLGIGTTSPGAKLEVAGQVKITGGAPGNGKVLTSDGTGLATWQTPSTGGDFMANGSVPMTGALTIQMNGDSNMIVLDDTNGGSADDVGISNNGVRFAMDHIQAPKDIFNFNLSTGNVNLGTTSAANARLTVHARDSNDSDLRFTNTTTGETASDGFVVGIDENEDAVIHNLENTNLIFATGNTERMRLDSSGKLGIGTTSPAEDLHVKSTNGLAAVMERTDGANVLQLRISNESGVGTNSAINQLQFATETSTEGVFESMGALRYRVEDATTGSVDSSISLMNYENGVTKEAIRIEPNGNVGIGTTSPEELLHAQSTTGTARLKVEGIANGGMIQLRNDTPTPAANTILGQLTYIGDDSAGNPHDWTQIRSVISNPTNGAEDTLVLFRTLQGGSMQNSMAIGPGGNVGIGTTTPSYDLEVIGDLRISGTPYRSGGDIAWQVPSDERLKDLKGDYEYGLREIASLDTIRFTYKENNPIGADSSKEYIGVMAQEVQKVMPEAVSTSERNKYLSLNTTPIFWALVNSTKELKNMCESNEVSIEKLKAENEKQSREITALNDRLQKLESKLENAQSQNDMILKYLCEKNPDAEICP